MIKADRTELMGEPCRGWGPGRNTTTPRQTTSILAETVTQDCVVTLCLTDKLVNSQAWANSLENKIYRIFLFNSSFKSYTRHGIFPLTVLSSNQHLLVPAPVVSSITLSVQTARSSQRHSLASYPIGLIFSLKEYKAHPPLPLPPPSLKCGG